MIDYFCCQIKKYVGEIYTIVSTGDVVYIGSDLPKEYTGSKYTNSIKGTNAKAKANAATGIPELIEIAVGKHFRENNEDKHRRDGKMVGIDMIRNLLFLYMMIMVKWKGIIYFMPLC